MAPRWPLLFSLPSMPKLKNCKRCQLAFLASRAIRYICLECRKCKWCKTPLSTNAQGSVSFFCNSSCFGKYNTTHSLAVKEHVRRIGHIGRQAAWAVTRGKAFPERRGENSPHWKGGGRPERAVLMIRVEYRTWRSEVLKRDNFTCQECGAKGVKFDVHHLVAYSEDPSKALDVDNGQTLCKPCHRKTPSYGFNGSRKSIPSQLSI